MVKKTSKSSQSLKEKERNLLRLNDAFSKEFSFCKDPSGLIYKCFLTYILGVILSLIGVIILSNIDFNIDTINEIKILIALPLFVGLTIVILTASYRIFDKDLSFIVKFVVHCLTLIIFIIFLIIGIISFFIDGGTLLKNQEIYGMSF